MIRSTIRSYASLFAGDVNQSRFTPTQYNDAINLGQQQFALESLALFKDNTITVVDGTATYDLPTDFMLEKEVTHKGLKLDPISRATIQFYARTTDWTTITGTPKYFLIDPEEARKQIRLYPSPLADDAGANLVLTYYPLPADLSSDSATPLNSSVLLVQFHIGIAAYAAWLVLGYEKATPEIVSKRADLYKQYQDKVTEARDKFGNTASEPLRLRGGRIWR